MKNIQEKINITELEVIKAQELWAQNVIEIGNLYTKNKDYKLRASIFVKQFYAFDLGVVLFKPTKCADEQFRATKEEALSYFIAGDERACKEDKGFAIQPWTKVRFENTNFIIENNRAIAMGNYFFADLNGVEAKVEYTFGYKLVEGELRIDLHHSSFPYNPA